jgi:hypothetical protein
MNTKKIIKALERWSPHGLCSGVLVEKNGVRSQTQACAVGCLALEFLHSKPGKRWLGKRDRSMFVRSNLYNNCGMDGATEKAIIKYYELDADRIADIINLNDCVSETDSAETNARRVKNSDLPQPLARTILRLRKRYDKWIAKQPGDEMEDSE